MKIEFNDLSNLLDGKNTLFEKSFLQKIGTALAKPVGWAARGAEIAATPYNLVKGAHRALTTTGGGNIATGLRELERGLKGERPDGTADNKEAEDKRRREMQRTGQSAKQEEFDKDIIQGIVSSSAAAASMQKGAASQNTTSGTMQGGGQVTQGQVISGGLPGATPAETSTGATTAKTTITPQAMQKIKIKPGDVFTIPSKFGRIQKYKIDKVDDKTNTVLASRLTTTV